MFVKGSAMESANAFWNEWEVWGLLFKNNLFADLLGSQYIVGILQTSLNVKNSKNVVKSGCSEKRLQWRAAIFFRNKEGVWSVLVFR